MAQYIWSEVNQEHILRCSELSSINQISLWHCFNKGKWLLFSADAFKKSDNLRICFEQRSLSSTSYFMRLSDKLEPNQIDSHQYFFQFIQIFINDIIGRKGSIFTQSLPPNHLKKAKKRPLPNAADNLHCSKKYQNHNNWSSEYLYWSRLSNISHPFPHLLNCHFPAYK